MKHIFRSWNEHYKMFIYFKHGCYFKDIGGKYPVLDNIDVRSEFWSNAEQSTKIANTECFVNDMLAVEISYSPFGEPDGHQEGVVRGVLKLDNLGFYLENDCEPIYLVNLPTIICVIVLGNTHQNPELLEVK